VSDERDGADAAGAGTEDNGTGGRGGHTAVVTPQRPTGKRSRQRALATTEVDDAVVSDADEAVDAGETESTKTKSKGKAKAKTAKASQGGGLLAPVKFVINYIKQVVAELRKVIWPNRKQMVSYTTVVLVFLVFMVALIGVVDLGLAKLVLLVFG